MKRIIRSIPSVVLIASLAIGAGALAQPDSPQFIRNPILASNRHTFSVCVSLNQSSNQRTSVGQIRTITELVVTNIATSEWKGPRTPPNIVEGCPSHPALLNPGVYREGMLFRGVGSLEVQRPSEHAVFIFVMRPEIIARLFSNNSPLHRIHVQERLCSVAPQPGGARCRDVTHGIYVSDQEFSSSEFMNSAIRRSMLLEIPGITNRPNPRTHLTEPTRTNQSR